MIDVESTLLRQYANSPTICQMVQNLNECISPDADIDAFYNAVFNIDTAEGFGLDIWGRIIAVDRKLYVEGEKKFFGFKNSDGQPFNQAPFYNPNNAEIEVYILQDQPYKKILLAKAMANISAASSQSINILLTNYFKDRGRAYVNDLGNMHIRYNFEFSLTQFERAVINQSGIFPRPSGVKVDILTSPRPFFGFKNSDGRPFNQAPFFSGE